MGRGQQRKSLITLPALPPALTQAVDGACRALWGGAEPSRDALPQAVASLSQAYTRERESLSDLQRGRHALWARLRFFMPRDLGKIAAPIHELAAAQALPAARRYRILDVGAGVGTTSLGAALSLGAVEGPESLQVTAVDKDGDALRCYESLARGLDGRLGLTLRLQTLVADADSLAGRLQGQRFELILVGLMLNELSDSADPERAHERVRRLGELLAPDGVMILLEPALRETTRGLMQLRDQLVATGDPPHLWAPCLHSGPCPMLPSTRDWCHRTVRGELPEPLGGIARAAGLRGRDLTYSYLTLGTTPAPAPAACDVRAVSAPLVSKGKLELDVCGPAGLTRLTLLDRHRDAGHRALTEAGRGSLLRLSEAPQTGEDRRRVGPQQPVEARSGWGPHKPTEP